MKTPLKLAAAAIAIITLTTFFTHSPLIQAQEAAPQQVVVPVIVEPANAQYRVIDTSQILITKGRPAAVTLEMMLNEMGAQGWKVVSGSGSFVILAH